MRNIGLILLGMLFLIGSPGQTDAAQSPEEIFNSIVKIRATISKEAESAGPSERSGRATAWSSIPRGQS